MWIKRLQLLAVRKVLRVVQKEVVAKNGGNLQQLMGVHVGFIKDFVDVGAVAVQLPCKPRNGMPVFYKLVADKFTYMYFFVHESLAAIKNVDNTFYLLLEVFDYLAIKIKK